MVRGVAEQTIFMIIIGIVLVLGFIWAIMTNFSGIRDAVMNQVGTARRMVADFSGSGGCQGLPTACKNWVYDGLGLYVTYGESGVYESASRCNVLESVCPSVAGSRIGVKDCLEMCTRLLLCDHDTESQGFDNVIDCYTSVVEEVQS